VSHSGAVFLFICFLFSAPATAEHPEKSNCNQAELEGARLVFHRAWFEQAGEQFQSKD